MKKSVRLLALLLPVFVFISLKAQNQNGYELSQLMNSSTFRETSKILDTISASNLPKAEIRTNKITAFPKFIPTRKYNNVYDFIHSNIEFPDEARAMGLYGIVKVQFDILPNGTIENLNFIESPDKIFNQEVRKILSILPRWQPAYSGSVPVASRYQLNIDFSLR